MKERVTVMDLVMEVVMMAIQDAKDDCCEKPQKPKEEFILDPSTVLEQQKPKEKVNFYLSTVFEPPAGQRCSGRNYQGRRCCTPEEPCDEGEGDCDGPSDGGGHDGHTGCKGKLECGSNNCKKFGASFHEKDDCCEKPQKPKEEFILGPFTVLEQQKPKEKVNLDLSTVFEPPAGQRCSG